ncbi:Cytochrome P450 [Hyphomicrobium sp. 1Nfss2.1]|uniref:cytochrome P450 n=1 Tax=Hyphomicrobium sp. 1Nfss2.1 TaxID=3413936 RepID=UPI003C7E5785
MTSEAAAYAQTLGDEQSIWFKISPFTNTDDPMGILTRLAARHGGCIPVSFRSERIFILSEVDHFRRVLVDNVDNYQKYFDGLKPIFGKAMITVDGALWQKVRQPQQAHFHPTVYADYIPYLMVSLRNKAEAWSRLASRGTAFEMLEQTWSLAADMICRALFDREVPFNPQVVFGAVKAYTDTSNHRSIRMKKVANGIADVAEDEAPARAISAWLTLPEAVISAEPWQGREKTLLKMMLDAEDDAEKPAWDHQQVLDEIKQYLWAGTETTALTLAWTFYLLSRRPDVAARIRREGWEVYGDREPTAADVERLTYTRSVMLEALRLYPPAWALIRTAVADDEIAGQKIRAGDRIVLCPYVAHHDPKYWDDPEEFRPERFDPANAKKRVKYSYIPFGAGKRFCLGGQLSQIEVMLALTQLLRRFEPEYLGSVPPPVAASVTLIPKGGLQFRLRELR